MDPSLSRLGISGGEALLVVVTAVGIYLAMIVFSRVFGQRQFTQLSSYDLAFTFALGSVVGRVILVRTSLAAGALGLATLFTLHALTGLLHHRVRAAHHLIQNRPVLLARDGALLEEQLRAAGTSSDEVFQQLRLQGVGSLADVGCVVLERNGQMSVLAPDARRDPDVFAEVIAPPATR